MRPTDEDQAGSRRPNLMSPTPPSSRRGNGEVNILAMLDGQADQPLSRRFLALPAALWYGLAGVLACALLGALAWLVRAPDNARAGARDAAASAPTPITMPAAAAATAQDPALAPRGATIVNLAPGAGDAAETVGAPGPGATGTPGASKTADTAAPAPSMRQALEAPDAAPGRSRHLPQPGAAPDPARHASRKDRPGNARAAAVGSGSQRAAAPPRTGTATSARAAATLRPDGPPRKRSAAPAKPGAAPGSTDTDVALISAIIQHVNKQGDSLDGVGAKDAKEAKDAKSPTNGR